jgi:dolichol-phosphate mannosyltransferase
LQNTHFTLKSPLITPERNRFMISIVIPTYNEKENIEDTIRDISNSLKGSDVEIIVVDDDSPDKTWEFCESLRDKYPVRVIRRVDKRGLSSAVIDGWAEAQGDIVGVMDADGSHDSRILPVMVEELISGKCDLAIGSRYIPGGATEGWPCHRQFVSKVAIQFARPITGIKDATSGFALFRKEILDEVILDPVGWKIVLEVAIKGKYKNYKEFPITFRDRLKGKSKLGKNAILNYLEHLGKLRKWMKENQRGRV